MSAYMIALVNVTDPEQFKKYAAAAGPATAKYGGKYLARGGETSLFEGEMPAERLVVIEFASREAAEIWYNSPEYQAAKKLREGAATGTFMAVDGA
ncbi:MAG: DUF1330 domain-containing protein [Rhizobiales bacterium]|nr:DUF1330 domain-containing protein [Hyphomicrobiales bacterium]